MRKFILSTAAMIVLGVGVSMAQSAEATTEKAPVIEKSCDKTSKKACCASKAGASADATTKKDCSSASASAEAATEQKATVTPIQVAKTNNAPVE